VLVIAGAAACMQVATFCLLVYIVRLHVRARRVANILSKRYVNMDCDDLLRSLIDDESPPVAPAAPVEAVADVVKKRARLAALTAGGQLKMSFKGHTLSVERVDSMTDAEIEELHTRYEARLGVAMSKSLGSSLLRMYANVASMVFPLPPERLPDLVADLENDPFVSSALNSACCQLYFRYGFYLAPLSAALTTAKHCVVKPAHTVEDTTPQSNTSDGSNFGLCLAGGTDGANTEAKGPKKTGGWAEGSRSEACEAGRTAHQA